MSLYTTDKRQTELKTSYKLVLKINDDGTPQKKKKMKKEEEEEKKRKRRGGRGRSRGR